MISLRHKIETDVSVGLLTSRCRFTALASTCGMQSLEERWGETLHYRDMTTFETREVVSPVLRHFISEAVLSESNHAVVFPGLCKTFLGEGGGCRVGLTSHGHFYALKLRLTDFVLLLVHFATLETLKLSNPKCKDRL